MFKKKLKFHRNRILCLFYRIKKYKAQAGVTLAEMLISVTVFAMLGVAVYGMFNYILRVEMQARNKVLAAKVASEQLEIVRNMQYDDVGTVLGSPAGALPQSKIVVMNNVSFNVSFSVEYFDDPFDGTAGGSPNDTNPLDYKRIQAEVTCAQCAATPIKMVTMVAPKGIEGAGIYGFLFIKVTKSDFLEPVVGADVNIVSVNGLRADINLQTDANGELKILDLLPGTEEYHITVTKTGYSSDYTVTPDVDNPTPEKPDATIVLGTVTPIDFQIDLVSTLNISSLNQSCGAEKASGSINFTIHGEKNLAKDPDVVYKYNSTFSTVNGVATISDLEWDTYSIGLVAGQGYDIIGFIPLSPFTLAPGSLYDLKIILAENSENKSSLRVTVVDNASGLPLTGIELTLRPYLGNEYLPHPITGQGFFSQTDWEGASGQRDYNTSNNTVYWSTDGNLEFTNNGEIKLKKTGSDYAVSGELISSSYDTSSVISNFIKLNWTPINQPTDTSIKFQIATSNSNDDVTVWDFYGYDGTAATYYDEFNQNINSIHNGYRFIRYKIILSTLDVSKTPSVSDISVSFNSACAPPGQVIFTNLDNGNNKPIDAVDTAFPKVYLDYSSIVDINNATELEIRMLK